MDGQLASLDRFKKLWRKQILENFGRSMEVFTSYMRCPHSITKGVLEFAESIVPGGRLVQVQSKPDRTFQALACFNALEMQVKNQGGEMVLGWCILEWPKAYLVAELHAIWKRPDGRFLDVAPHEVVQKSILFLPDPKAVIPEIQEENRFWPIADNELVHRYIAAERAAYQAGDPASRYLVTTLAWDRAQQVLVSARAELVSQYGWPPGTPRDQKALGSIFTAVSQGSQGQERRSDEVLST